MVVFDNLYVCFMLRNCFGKRKIKNKIKGEYFNYVDIMELKNEMYKVENS